MDSLGEALAVLLAGFAAGTVNAVVGSGTLITFPVLLAVGYPPVVANVSNNVGLVPGSLSGAYGYRRELAGQGPRARRLIPMSLLGAAIGAVLLLALPAEYFKTIVPGFIALALAGILLQPRLSARLARREDSGRPDGGPAAQAGVFVAGVYGGYFGAAQGILLLSVMGLTLREDLHRINALKNVLALTVNTVAGAIFLVVADVAWEAAGLVAAGAFAGGYVGGRYGRRLPPGVLRALIVVVGAVAIVQLV